MKKEHKPDDEEEEPPEEDDEAHQNPEEERNRLVKEKADAEDKKTLSGSIERKQEDQDDKLSYLSRISKQILSKPESSTSSTTSWGSAGAEQVLVGKEPRGQGGGAFMRINLQEINNQTFSLYETSCQATNAAYRLAYSEPPSLNSGVGRRPTGWNGAHGPIGQQEILAPSAIGRTTTSTADAIPRGGCKKTSS